MKQKILTLIAAFGLVAVFGGAVYAADNSTFNQEITTGTLSTDILDSTGAAVGAPSITLTSKLFSFSCYDSSSPSTGTFGSNNERIYVINPDAADGGWNVSLAATSGTTAQWSNTGASENYDFNDATGSGCTDGGDTDGTGGQMTLDPNAGTITLDCASTCTSTGVTKGSETAYSEGSVDSVTLMSASAGSDDVWRGYLTGVGVEQTIPAQQATDNYSINMTLTVATA